MLWILGLMSSGLYEVTIFVLICGCLWFCCFVVVFGICEVLYGEFTSGSGCLNALLICFSDCYFVCY